MQATRYRLRFITGVSLSAATYGSGTYGAGTYGEQASDPLAAVRYAMIPWPAGYLSDPSWVYRQCDVQPPFRVSVQADNGMLDFTGLESALLVLTNTDGASDVNPWMFTLTVITEDGADWLTREWLKDDLVVPGTYRAALVLKYESGRRLTIPADDRHNFVITPNSTLPIPEFPPYRWDEARWDYAYWSKEST